MDLDAGKLRYRVTIERPEATTDSLGSQSTTWSTVASCWAAIETLSAREFFAASQHQSEVTGKIIIRHRADIDASMRIRRGDVLYAIQGVLTDNMDGVTWSILLVSQGVTDGR